MFRKWLRELLLEVLWIHFEKEKQVLDADKEKDELKYNEYIERTAQRFDGVKFPQSDNFGNK